MNKELSFTKKVNEFIDSLKEDDHTIEVITVGNETFIRYEDWEHEPIKNFTTYNETRGAGRGPYNFSEEGRALRIEATKRTHTGKTLTEEHKKKISETMKGVKKPDAVIAKVSKARKEYYKRMKAKNNEDNLLH